MYPRNKFLTILLAAAAIALSSCGGAKLATANEQMERGEYFDASRTYRKVYNKLTKREDRPLRGEVAYKIAECHRRMNQFAQASAAYQNAARYSYGDSVIYLRMAQMMAAEGKYPQAIKAYKDYLEWKPADKLAQNGLIGAEMARDKKGATRYVVKNAKLFNSRSLRFLALHISTSSLDQLYFTSTNEKVTGTKKSEITGLKKGDIWFAGKDEQGRWKRPEPVEGELNSDADEGAIAVFTRRLDHVSEPRPPRAERANRCGDIHLTAFRCQMERAGEIRDYKRYTFELRASGSVA